MIVYSLTDPDSGIVRYIGISKHTAKQRFATHLKDAKTRQRKGEYLSKKEKWILDLNSKSKKPIIQTLFSNLSEDEAIDKEAELIKEYKMVFEGGVLYNVQEGGHYDSCLCKVWNKNVKNCYSSEFLNNNRHNQPNKKTVYRFDKNGNFIDQWESIRVMCKTLSFDRRSVMRCLHQESNFKSHKGFMFSFEPEAPVYINNSSLHTYHNHACAKAIVAIKDNCEYNFKSIREASEKLNIPAVNISSILTGAYHKSKGYTFKYK